MEYVNQKEEREQQKQISARKTRSFSLNKTEQTVHEIFEVTFFSYCCRETQRPDWLVSRLRTVSVEEPKGPRLSVVRQPKGPDGTRGFKKAPAVKAAAAAVATVAEETNGYASSAEKA